MIVFNIMKMTIRNSYFVPLFEPCYMVFGEGIVNPLKYTCLRILWTRELGGLQSTRLQRVGHD